MSADANVFRWAIRRFFSKTELDAGALDARYFAESEFVSTSAGAGDAGKPVKLNGSGLLDVSMLTGSLTGYALLAGRAGGQTLKGGTASGEDLTLQSTNHATKGKILFASGGAYDEVNTRLGVGVTSPTYRIEAQQTVNGDAGLLLLSNPNNVATNSASLHFATFSSAAAPTASIKAINEAGGAATALGFYVHSGAALPEVMRIASTGAVSMTATLNVVGNITQNSVAVVTITGTQTLTNKTLTAPIISTISNTGTLTLPTSTDTLVGRATTDTLTNKTLTTPTISSTGFTNAQHAHTGASSGGQLDHGAALTGLGDDDHTQYALLAGRASGQTINGGNAANEDLTIHGTAHATKTSSYVIIQPSGGQTIVGASSPIVTHPFEVQANSYAITLNPGYLSATNYVSSYTSGSPAPLALYGSRVFIDGDTFGIGTAKTPTSSADATGSTGDICWNSTHLFVKTGAGAWKRVALSTF